jgi:hypothetical protein
MAAASWMAARKWWPACRSGRRCGGVLDAPEHALDGLAAAVRRQAAGAAPAPAARLDLARCVPLPGAHARPQGDALRLLSPHRLSAARRGVISGAMRRATHSVFTLPLVGRVGAKRRGGGRAVTRWRRLTKPSSLIERSQIELPPDATGRIVRLRTNVRRKLNGRGLVVGREEQRSSYEPE